MLKSEHKSTFNVRSHSKSTHNPYDYAITLLFAILTDMHFLKDNLIVAALSALTISGRKRTANRHDGHRHDRQFLRCLGCCERTVDQYKEPCPKMQQG